jgi:hypothetical protein
MTYNVPIVDFVGPLSNLGKNLGSMRREQKIGEALSALGPDASWEDRANAIMKIDPGLALKLSKFGTEGDGGGITPYQSERLAIERANSVARNKDRRPALEVIRGKIANGEPLSPGEEKVYKDSLRTDPFSKLLDHEEAPIPAAPTPQSGIVTRKVPTETIAAPPISKGPMAMPTDKSALGKGQVYDLPNGKQGLWNGTEFELL